MCAFIAGVTSTVALESIGYDISKPATGLGILGFFIIGYLNSKPHPIINTIIYSLVFSIIIILIGAIFFISTRQKTASPSSQVTVTPTPTSIVDIVKELKKNEVNISFKTIGCVLVPYRRLIYDLTVISYFMAVRDELL